MARVSVHYTSPFDWHDSFSTTADLSTKVYSFEEVTRKPTYSANKAQWQRKIVSLEVRYALYNTKKDALVFDRTTTIKAGVTTYSKDPAISSRTLNKLLHDQMLAKITRHTCPKIGEVSRSLISAGGESRYDRLIEEGVALAEDDQWAQAAEKWQNAILVNQKSAVAHHNLGIYFERSGNIPKSVEEFERAQNGKDAHLIPKQQFEGAIDQYRPLMRTFHLRPKLLTVSSSNLVTITGGSKKKRLSSGETYPVFRSKRILNAKYQPEGIHLLEVGKVRVHKAKGRKVPRYEAKITEFLKEAQLQPGDTIYH